MATEQAVTKFAAITEALRRRILEGVYAPGSRIPSINELPAEFGVGKQTIVRVMADLARDGLIVSHQGSGTFVAPVLPAAGTGGLQKVRPLTLALVFRRTLSPETYKLHGWFGGVVAGVLAGLGIDLSAARVTTPDAGDQEPGRARIEQTGNPHRIELLGEPRAVDSGVPFSEIFALQPDAVLPVSIFDDAYLLRLVDAADVRKVPAVLIDYWTRRLGTRADCVVVDNHPGYHAACEGLLCRGLRRIHFVGAYSASHTEGHFRDGATQRGRVDPDSYQRMAAWRQAMDEADLDAPPDWTHFTVGMPAEIERLAGELWALPPDQRPEALLCHDAGMARHLREAFARRGGSLETMGVGEAAPGQRLTVNAQDIGRTAADLAIARMRAHGLAHAPKPFVKAAVPTHFQTT